MPQDCAVMSDRLVAAGGRFPHHMLALEELGHRELQLGTTGLRTVPGRSGDTACAGQAGPKRFSLPAPRRPKSMRPDSLICLGHHQKGAARAAPLLGFKTFEMKSAIRSPASRSSL